MALFGRESKADTQRAKRMRTWIEARCPLALASVLLGIVAVVDAFTLVVGVMAGVAAIVTGIKGLNQLKLQPQLLGRRLCIAGIALGVTGIAMSLIMLTVIYPALKK